MLFTFQNLILFFLAAMCEIVCAYQPSQKHGPTPTPYHDWDYLIFSQRWPITSCAEWEEAKPENTCTFPPDKYEWTVHGIWPTKFGKEGPLFCPSAIHFDPEQLDPLLDDLNAHWTNVEANTKSYSFWKHEWDKHGTCSTNLPQLNSIPNFFMKGLEWNKAFNLTDMLAQSKILPGSTGYTTQQIYDAIKAVTKYNPMIECVVDRHTKDSMVSEIRICLNKSLELMDCDATNPVNRKSSTIITNCSGKKPIMYLDNVPPNSIHYQMDYIDDLLEERYQLSSSYMELYKILKFLIWFTI